MMNDVFFCYCGVVKVGYFQVIEYIDLDYIEIFGQYCFDFWYDINFFVYVCVVDVVVLFNYQQQMFVFVIGGF